MKRKFLIALLLLVSVLCLSFGLVACGRNNSDDTDKAKQNAEFVEYRKAVVSVLKDNGIFVNDYDNVTGVKKSKATNNKSVTLATSWKEDKNPIKNLLQKPEYWQNAEDYAFAQRQVYAISLRLSLCIGDGITTYFGEKNFYGITVKIGDIYLKVTKAGNDTYTIQGYTLQGSDGNTFELFDFITLRYTSVNDYDFTFIEWNNQSSYFGYGNSDKELLLVSENDVIYSPDSARFYATQDSETVSQCAEQVQYAKPTNVEPFIALKGEVRYTIDGGQSDALFDKYFKDVQSTIGEQKGLETEDIDGRKVACSYRAIDGETTVEIPYGTEYLAERFVVYDKIGNVKNLVIPSTVKGVVQTNDPKTGELLNEFRTIDPENLEISLIVDNIDKIFVFEKISVDKNNSIFKSENGSLYTVSGKIVYLADSPLKEFNLDMFNDRIIGLINEGIYKHVFENMTEITLGVNNEKCDAVLQNVLPQMKFLTTLYLNGAVIDNSQIYITVNKDLTVNCEFDCGWDYKGWLPRLQFRSERSANVTVNLKNMAHLVDINTENVRVTVNTDLPKKFYEQTGQNVPSDGGDISYNFSEKYLTDEQADVLHFELHNRSGQPELKASLSSFETQINSVRIPEEVAGYRVTALELWETDISQIELTDNIRYILIESFDEQNTLTIKYDGTAERFETNIQIICFADTYSFTLAYNGGTKQMSGTKNIPQSDLCTVTMDIGTEQLVIENVRKGRPINFDYNIKTKVAAVLSKGCYYAFFDGKDVVIPVYCNFDDTYMSVDFGEITPTSDITYKLVKLHCDSDDFLQNVNLSKNGFTLTGTINWQAQTALVENANVTYNGNPVFVADTIKLNNTNRFYIEGNFENDKGEPVSQKFIDITFKIYVDNDGYLAVDLDTVKEQYVI